MKNELTELSYLHDFRLYLLIFSYQCLIPKMKIIVFIITLLSVNHAYPRRIDLTMVGDIGFNKNGQAPQANYVEAYGRRTEWRDLTSQIKNSIDGDIIFGNLETVISDTPLRPPAEKKFKFQSHPNSIQHMIELGFNLFSMSNNHAGDYGRSGLNSTYAWINYFADTFGIEHHGIGPLDEVLRPKVFQNNRLKIAFIAIGIDGFGLTHAPVTENQIGNLNFRSSSHVTRALTNLKNTPADFKIVSFHHGSEGTSRLDAGQKEIFRRFVDEGGANLVIGHHPHVVRAVEIYKDSLIAYSLGNFLLIGAANIDNRPLGQSYGLILKATADISRNRVKFENLQAIPIQGMHYQPSLLTGEAYTSRIDYLNSLSRADVGETSVIFSY